jgi:uncharacterized protein YifE (UPF0438 family)
MPTYLDQRDNIAIGAQLCIVRQHFGGAFRQLDLGRREFARRREENFAHRCHTLRLFHQRYRLIDIYISVF